MQGGNEFGLPRRTLDGHRAMACCAHAHRTGVSSTRDNRSGAAPDAGCRRSSRCQEKRALRQTGHKIWLTNIPCRLDCALTWILLLDDPPAMWGRITSGSILVLASSPAHAMSPAQSLVEVFTYNPTIAGDRARAEADRIEVDIAKADGRFDFRTRIDAQHDFVNSDYRLQPRSASALTATVRVSLPLTAGGRVRTRVSGQLARASASAAQFEEVENRVLGQAVDAHLDVARDRVLLELQKEQRTVLEQLLESARFRARLGDLTRTDVDQARARLASSQAATVTAEAALTLSSAQYWALTGKQPDADMQVDDGLPRLPNMADIIALLDTAPAYKAAVFRRQEAEAAVRYARSQRYPSISAFAELGNQLAGSDG